ncbi:MAG: hypothetical protein HYV40_02495 [Candidatus Levybacteria bacterium]|nr:hypothetical protein [Candidatus Levybacteria bacterium]
MSDAATTTVKKTRTRKTTTSVSPSESTVSSPKTSALEESFNGILQQISESKAEFLALQWLIEETKQTWVREQREHELLLAQRDEQDEIARKREQETYTYETKKARQQAEDEFAVRKAKWERELDLQKESIEAERRELTQLRKQVEGFEAEKQKAVKEATMLLEKELSEQFSTERKLREQEMKAEKELLALKIANLSGENARSTKEIDSLKKALDDATAQLKDVAVKVIESRSVASHNAPQTET